MSNPDDLFEDPYPYQDLIGYKLVSWTPEGCEVHLPLHRDLGNRYGLPHGGVYATLLDTAMGFAGAYTGSKTERRLAMTLSLNVNYLSRPKGKMLICKGRKTGGGANTFFAEAAVYDETEELIATGTGAFRLRAKG
jgi:uncharacterized protein (TIGR00369 family)